MKQKIATISFVLVLSCGVWATANAAEVELTAPLEAKIGQAFSIEVKFSQPKEPVNAVSGKIIFNPEEFKLNSISSGGSVISLWLQSPESLKEGEIEFAGVTPGGLLAGKIFTFELTPLKAGQGSISLKDVKFVSSDGSGKSFAGEPAVASIIIKAEEISSENMEPKPKDILPPLPFVIQIARDESIFNNQWFAVFNAVDSGSGIGYYEAAESPVDDQNNLIWQKTSSPYLLKDQNRKSFVFIKAVDREGNYVISKLKPAQQSSGLGNFAIYGIIAMIIGVICAALFWLKKQNVKKSSQAL